MVFIFFFPGDAGVAEKGGGGLPAANLNGDGEQTEEEEVDQFDGVETSELEVVRVEEVVVQEGLLVTQKTPAEDAGRGGLLRRCSGAPRLAWWRRKQRGRPTWQRRKGVGGVGLGFGWLGMLQGERRAAAVAR